MRNVGSQNKEEEHIIKPNSWAIVRMSIKKELSQFQSKLTRDWWEEISWHSSRTVTLLVCDMQWLKHIQNALYRGSKTNHRSSKFLDNWNGQLGTKQKLVQTLSPYCGKRETNVRPSLVMTLTFWSSNLQPKHASYHIYDIALSLRFDVNECHTFSRCYWQNP